MPKVGLSVTVPGDEGRELAVAEQKSAPSQGQDIEERDTYELAAVVDVDHTGCERARRVDDRSDDADTGRVETTVARHKRMCCRIVEVVVSSKYTLPADRTPRSPSWVDVPFLSRAPRARSSKSQPTITPVVVAAKRSGRERATSISLLHTARRSRWIKLEVAIDAPGDATNSGTTMRTAGAPADRPAARRAG
jgi:hypothetical protein